jgi:predicted secreted protein
MAILTGNNGVVKIANSSAVLKTIAAVKTFSIDLKADTIETTTMGVDVRTYLKGLSSWSGSADVYFDLANYTGGASEVHALNPTSGVVGASPLSVELYLADTADKFSGNIIVTGYNVKSSMDGMVEATISFQGSGACTFTV